MNTHGVVTRSQKKIYTVFAVRITVTSYRYMRKWIYPPFPNRK